MLLKCDRMGMLVLDIHAYVFASGRECESNWAEGKAGLRGFGWCFRVYCDSGVLNGRARYRGIGWSSLG